VKIINGNIFNSKAETLVNTVNCVGAMGKGIALEFRRRYPNMFEEYKKACANNELKPGHIWQYNKGDVSILNFAIKNDWKYPSKIEWIEKCLIEFNNNYSDWCVKSVAFPWMGAMNGQIPFDKIRNLMIESLERINDVEIEIYTFNPDEGGPLFCKLLEFTEIERLDLEKLIQESGIQKRSLEILIEELSRNEIKSLFRLEESKVLGKTNIEKLYAFLIDPNIVPTKYEKMTWF